IHHLVCTDGSKGSWDPDVDTAQLVARRQNEQRAAAYILGGRDEVTFLGWPDGELEAGPPQRRQVAEAIRRIRPQVVLGHDPWKRYRLHPDHRNAGFLLTDAVVAAREPRVYPDMGLDAHRPRSVLLWEADEPDHVEAVEAFLDRKIDALMAHRSQLRSTMGIGDQADVTAQAAFEEHVRTRAAEAGGLAGVICGEAFKAITP
ncbi:MAG: PIG-L deacetylase family protein, partial [Acidimicrobiales bacterium]